MFTILTASGGKHRARTVGVSRYLCHSPAQHPNRAASYMKHQEHSNLFSNSASAEGRKSDVTPVCFQTSSPRKHTNTQINITCSLMTSMTVQIAHYYHTIAALQSTKTSNKSCFCFCNRPRCSNSEHQGGNSARWMFVFPSKVYSYYANLVQRTKLIYFSFAITWASRAEQALVFVPCRGVCWEKSEAISWMCERQLGINAGFTPTKLHWILQACVSCSRFMFADRCSAGPPAPSPNCGKHCAVHPFREWMTKIMESWKEIPLRSYLFLLVKKLKIELI